MMFGKFTDEAQKILAVAQEEAVNLGQSNIGTEHLLLGLLRDDNSLASKVLSEFNITLSYIRNSIEKLVSKGTEKVHNVRYTPRAKKVVELSMDEARKLGHSYVGSEHILLGLIREGEGVAARLLSNGGVSLNKTRQLIMNNLVGVESGSSSHVQNNVNTPTLDSLARDLTQIARDGKLDPVIGRSKEIKRVVEILSRRTKNNPVLVGEPGVGKTAVVEGLAQRIVNNDVPDTLKNKRVMVLDMGTMVAGTKYRGEFEDRMKKVTDEIVNAGNVIVFIDEIHTMIGAGGAEGSVDASNILKPSLARGELQCIGATTINEYRKYIEKDSALERRFQPVNLNEPTEDETIQILNGLKKRYEEHHKVTYDSSAIESAVKLSSRYITDRFLPDKAIDLIDEAAAKVRLNLYESPTELKELEISLNNIIKSKEEAVQGQDFETAAKLRDEEQKFKDSIFEFNKSRLSENSNSKLVVTEHDIAQVVSSWTGVPVSKITEEESSKLMKLEERLHKRVVGQNEAITAISKSVRRARAGLKDPKRPIGSFIFLGQTGVGKTEVARTLAETLFGDEDALIRVDMSEYMEKHSTSRLVGAPPGYVGHDEGGQLTEKVRRKPYSVILLDEIEKAHPEVFNILLQVLDDGRLTDSKGRTVDFRNTIVIMTSNIGASELKENKYVGFTTATADKKHNDMKSKVMDALKKSFRPEFLNRIDDTIVFHSLDKTHIKEIVSLMVNQLEVRLKDIDIHIELTTKAKDQLLEEGYDSEYGARPLRRAIQKNIEDLLSEELLIGNIQKGQKVVVDFSKDKFIVKSKAKTSGKGKAKVKDQDTKLVK